MVSIIMPVYNASKYLRDAISSVLLQTYVNFEFIIVDDGSTDNSEEIIHACKDVRIKYIYQENQGVASALNHGLTLACGKYIWRHDADDISLPTKLQAQVEFLENNPEFVLCGTQISFMTEKGLIAPNFRQPKNSFFHNAEWVEVKREHFNPYSPITHATVLVRTDSIKQVGGYRSEFKTAEDIDLWLRLLDTKRLVTLNRCDYFVRIYPSSATASHGWKNEFYRNMAFKFYNQRQQFGKDDLQNGMPLLLPNKGSGINSVENPEKSGGIFRSNIIYYSLPLYLDAKDWELALTEFKQYIRDGWKLAHTWKHLFLFIIGRKTAQRLVKIKKLLFW